MPQVIASVHLAVNGHILHDGTVIKSERSVTSACGLYAPRGVEMEIVTGPVSVHISEVNIAV